MRPTQDAKALAKPFELRTATHIVHCDWHCEDVKRQAGFILEISMNAYNRKVMDVCQNCGAALKAALESAISPSALIAAAEATKKLAMEGYPVVKDLEHILKLLRAAPTEEVA